MHYHVVFCDAFGQVAVLTGHHTYRDKAAALAAVRRLGGYGVYTHVVYDNPTRRTWADGDCWYITACENPQCRAKSDTQSVGQ
jgi:hypothetical protein